MVVGHFPIFKFFDNDFWFNSCCVVNNYLSDLILSEFYYAMTCQVDWSSVYELSYSL